MDALFTHFRSSYDLPTMLAKQVKWNHVVVCDV